ncbi:hypothetical protein B5S31_g5892 [[Candida] boidinii]|nr:hypothetical protein B5S31_g5892 [[Candida] boidinii]
MFFFIMIGRIDFTVKKLKELRFYCPHCHNVSMKLVKHLEFISIFFIPILPVYYKKELKCEICRYSKELGKDEIKRIEKELDSNDGNNDNDNKINQSYGL